MDTIIKYKEYNIDWDTEDVIYIYDFTKLKKLYHQWNLILPRVHPFYAIKCNPNPLLIKNLSECGACFDCASPSEIQSILNLDISPSKILYANPCKRVSDIIFMKNAEVEQTTFDSVCELNKLAEHAPSTKCILRIYANDPQAQCILSNKYGAFEEEWEPLLQHAHTLGLDVIGVSFHVGSGASNPDIFRQALRNSKYVADIGEKYGFRIRTIDIGGGFSTSNIHKMAQSINDAIEEYFTDDFNFIAEPGRYFAETIASLYTKVIGVRERRGTRDYFITDSIYGSFNCLLYDHCKLNPIPLKHEKCITKITSTIFGPTCDGGDTIIENIMLPKMEPGDWLKWENMGAYTIAGSCDFNGINFTAPHIIYV